MPNYFYSLSTDNHSMLSVHCKAKTMALGGKATGCKTLGEDLAFKVKAKNFALKAKAKTEA